MTNKKLVSAGEVLTTSLLKKLSKEAYQYGGLEVNGEFVRKSALNTEARTSINIQKKHIKGDVDKFINEFSVTMSAYYYKLNII